MQAMYLGKWYVNGSCTSHLGSFQNVFGIFLLAEKHTIFAVCDLNTKEIMQVTHVIHWKFRLTLGDQVMKKR